MANMQAMVSLAVMDLQFMHGCRVAMLNGNCPPMLEILLHRLCRQPTPRAEGDDGDEAHGKDSGMPKLQVPILAVMPKA